VHCEGSDLVAQVSPAPPLALDLSTCHNHCGKRATGRAWVLVRLPRSRPRLTGWLPSPSPHSNSGPAQPEGADGSRKATRSPASVRSPGVESTGRQEDAMAVVDGVSTASLPPTRQLVDLLVECNWVIRPLAGRRLILTSPNGMSRTVTVAKCGRRYRAKLLSWAVNCCCRSANMDSHHRCLKERVRRNSSSSGSSSS
jgi:hypothetical protein